eukprot:1707418-Pyramimonas_sp.AAC.2
MATGCGFPAHSSGHAPCLLCSWDSERILQHRLGDHLDRHPPGSYDRHCKGHEIWVFISSEEMHRRIRWTLEFKSSFRGRTLVED